MGDFCFDIHRIGLGWLKYIPTGTKHYCHALRIPDFSKEPIPNILVLVIL